MRSDPLVSPSSVVPAAVQANLVLLAQGTELIGRLSDESYNCQLAVCFNYTLGGHFRHVVEHYQGLLAAIASGDIDYENRERNSRIETDPDYALAVVQQLKTGLMKLATDGAEDRPMRMKSETGDGGWLGTSLGRELEFLISHTVHHYALMAVIAGQQDAALPVDFGLAPSTLKFQRTENAACAR